jgi:magnesium-transporting ATPase (P-type)
VSAAQVTGDHVLTALAVARACGMVREDEDIIVGDVGDRPLAASAAADEVRRTSRCRLMAAARCPPAARRHANR